MSEDRIAVLSDALKSIAGNTCCNKCQEAALVARSALASYVGIVRSENEQIERMREALRHANIDLCMLLPEVANRDMVKSIRKTLDMIEECSK